MRIYPAVCKHERYKIYGQLFFVYSFQHSVYNNIVSFYVRAPYYNSSNIFENLTTQLNTTKKGFTRQFVQVTIKCDWRLLYQGTT